MKQAKILVVEDEAVVSLALSETLGSLGYTNIDTSLNAEDAQENLLRNSYDIVLMDINLGGEVDGVDVMNSVKQYVNTPFLYLTGNSDWITVDKAKHSQPHGFLVKPYNVKELAINIEIILLKSKEQPTEKRTEKPDLNNHLKQLVIRIGREGQIKDISPYVERMTERPPEFYRGKTLKTSEFDPFFSSALANILSEVISTKTQVFYINMSSKLLGERRMEVVVIPDSFAANNYDSFILFFNDITEKKIHRPQMGSKPIKLALASVNSNIIRGFRSITRFVENTHVAAELQDFTSMKAHFSANTGGVLVIDIDFPELTDVLRFISNMENERPKTLVMAMKTDYHKLKLLKELYPIDGFFSKIANDTTIKDAIISVLEGEEYTDTTIHSEAVQ